MTLITPSEVIGAAFTPDALLPPEEILTADIAAAEVRYIRPVVGAELHARLLAGAYPEFTADFLREPLALFTRVVAQQRLDVRSSRIGTQAPAHAADRESARGLRLSLLREARALLRRASDYLDAHAGEFPEYTPHLNPLKHTTIDGGIVQTF